MPVKIKKNTNRSSIKNQKPDSLVSKRKYVFAFFTFMTIIGTILPNAGAFDMVPIKDGKAQAVIVCDAAAPDSVRYAAAELQQFLEKISDCRLTIVSEPPADGSKQACLYVGASRFTKSLGVDVADLKPDGFKIVGGTNWVAILGRDYSGTPISLPQNPFRLSEVYNSRMKLGVFGECGTLHGVYQLLEKCCGIRWYWPGELGTVIPRMETVKIQGADIVKAPDYEYRYPWLCNFEQSDEGAAWFHRLGFGGKAPVWIIHSFNQFQKYKDSHPEYFALIGGKRDFDRLSCSQGGGNLCLSNPDVIKQWITDINDYFDKNPGQTVYPLVPSDGMRGICECDKCQEQIDKSQEVSAGMTADTRGRFSNYVWNFVNEVAKGVAISHPDKYVGGAAYADYTLPPNCLERLDPHVAVMVCKDRKSYCSLVYRKKVEDLVNIWRKKTDHIYIWEYYLFRNQWVGCPIVLPRFIAEDLRWLKGFSRGEFVQAELWDFVTGVRGNIELPGMRHLNVYVTSKLYWDTSLDLEGLLNEYYNLFYGPAADEMKTFWTTAEKIWCGKGEMTDALKIYTQERLKTLDDCLLRAKEKAAPDTIYRKRIDVIANEFAPFRNRLSNPLLLSPPEMTLAGPRKGCSMDCNLKGSGWESVSPIRLVNKEGGEAKYKTFVYPAWDADCLYLLFVNYEPEISKLKVLATDRDQVAPAVYSDDSVEIFINPDLSDRQKCYQFVVNAKGVIWDGRRGFGLDYPAKWDSQMKACARSESDRWIACVKISFKDIGVVPKDGVKFAMNLYRNRYCGGAPVYGCWSPSLSPRHFDPDHFGVVGLDKRND